MVGNLGSEVEFGVPCTTRLMPEILQVRSRSQVFEHAVRRRGEGRE